MGIASLIGILAVLTTAIMVIVTLTTAKKHQKVQETMSEGHDHPFSLEGSSALAQPSQAPESASITSDGPKRDVRAGGSLRDALEAELRERASSGRCLICTERSTHPMPRRSRVRSVLDPLFRHYQIVAADRYRIDVHIDVDHPPVLCEAHHHVCRGALERKSAEMTERYAAFVEKGRYEMLEYERFEVFETVLGHEQEIRSRKPQKRQKPEKLAAVVSIGEKKAANGG
jgi:hypothetical protein